MSGKTVCCGSNTETLILACSGGSNVGQISNKAMIEMDKLGLGSAYCVAGAGADLPSFVEATRMSNTIVLDGCPVGCAREILNRHRMKPWKYYVITELGIDKRHSYEDLEAETEKALKQITKSVQASGP